ncbi:hypothetical protein SAMN05446635_2923 [Burkholderia sp. OK233]|nr:hypothetical protein SAMN05446635_2923 [Burkholderia sp. OK233]
MTIDYPNALLDTLLSNGEGSHRRAKLTATHEICPRHHEPGPRDFSLPTIGHFAEAEGILEGRVLYNPQSADYRALVIWLCRVLGKPERHAVPRPRHHYCPNARQAMYARLVHAPDAEVEHLVLKVRGHGAGGAWHAT